MEKSSLSCILLDWRDCMYKFTLNHALFRRKGKQRLHLTTCYNSGTLILLDPLTWYVIGSLDYVGLCLKRLRPGRDASANLYRFAHSRSIRKSVSSFFLHAFFNLSKPFKHPFFYFHHIIWYTASLPYHAVLQFIQPYLYI